MNSAPGIWNTLIHREAAEVNGGPTRINDQQFGSSDDLFIDHCSLTIERSADAFGIKIAGAGSTPNQILCSGEYLDLGTGNYALRNRIYQQNTGTFLTADTTPGQLPYVYTSDNPVMFADPSGHISIPSITVSIGISLMLGGGATWWAGDHFNDPVLAGVGENITEFGAGVVTAGVGFMIAPELGASVLAVEIPAFVVNLVYTWGAGGLAQGAKGAAVSAAVPGFLSDYYYYAESQSRGLPPSGRIVVRGAAGFGDVPDAGGPGFGAAAVPLRSGDYVYDYSLVGSSGSGEMAVVAGEVLPNGEIQVDGRYVFTSGTVSALPFAQPLAAPPPQILVIK